MPGRSRRQLIEGTLALAGLGLLAGCGLPAVPWPRQARIPRIGYLGPGMQGPYPSLVDAFRQGLRDLEYVEGRDIAIEYRFTDERLDQAPGLAAELVALNVDLIVTTGVEAAAVAKGATSTIPIVGTILGPDPVGSGLVASHGRPGGNVTGLSTASPSGMPAKRLQLLKETIPSIGRVAVLWNPENPGKLAEVKEVEAAAAPLGLEIASVEARRGDELERAFVALTAARADAVSVIQDPWVFGHSARIVTFAAEHRMPAIYEVRAWVEAGGLMNYGINSADLFRRAATYVDKILKGARPADLPVEQPIKFDFTINAKAARALGLTIPPSVLQQATQIVE